MLFSGRRSWQGESGETWRFSLARQDTDIPDAGGIYIMARRVWLFRKVPVYIGKASNLRSRLIGHERWDEAHKTGARLRYYLRVRSENKRQRIEEDLIREYLPVLNEIHKPKHDCDAPNHKALRRRWMCADEYWGLGRFAPASDAETARLKKHQAQAYYTQQG